MAVSANRSAVCQACGAQNMRGANYCSECGARLAAAQSTRRERRVVSVVFADVVGFTSRSERLDVEDVEEFLAHYHALLRQELERHGGVVEKFVGDAVMAVFGAPVAHEDDPERAVRAGLSIQDAVEELRERDEVDVHVRVGVTSGKALVILGADPHAGEGMAVGDVVNTAARLQTAAPVDGVLVDAWTHRATNRAIRYAEAGSVDVKGKSAPVAVWRALQPRAEAPERRGERDLPLIGRRDELTLLTAALSRSRGEPSTQVVTLVGVPGIGKTRLVDELGAHVEDLPDLVRWRQGRSLAYGDGVAFWSLGEMVKAEAGILESDSAELASSKLEDAVTAVVVGERDREWVRGHLQPLVGLEGRARLAAKNARVDALAAWRRFFESLAEDGPTVLVFEDIQWADDALLDFIDLLIDRAGAIPLFIVCTARPELVQRRPNWSGGKINAQTILLPPLSDEDTARLLSKLLDQAQLPEVTQRALLSRAEGNPLYAQEYVRMLRDQGVLVRDRSGWRITATPERVPESVQAIIAARLDTLTDWERCFVHDAAVLGRTAWSGAVSAVADTAPGDVQALLQGLEAKQVVRRARRSSIAGEAEFSFAHALIQDVAYHQIPRSERSKKHERAAVWIERQAGQRDDKAELLAHHYAAALHLREQASGDTTPLVPKARAALAEAAHRAEAVNAHGLAAQHARAALDLTPADDPLRPRVLHVYCQAKTYEGSATDATYETALRAQVASSNWQAAAEVCLWWSDWYLNYRGDGVRAEELLNLGMAHSRRAGYTHVESLVADQRAFLLIVAGRSSEALRLSGTEMHRAEQAGDVEGRAILLSRHGAALVNLGDLRGVEEMRDAAETLAELDDIRVAVVAYWNYGEVLAVTGDLGRAGEVRRQALRLAQRSANQLVIESLIARLGEAAYHNGEWDAALAACTPRLSHPAQDVMASACWTHGQIALARGDARTGAEDAQRVIQFGSRTHNAEYLLSGLALAAQADSATNGPSTRPDALENFYQEWEATGGIPTEAHSLAELVFITSPVSRIRRAAEKLPSQSRWRAALIAMVEQRYAEAAILYREIGSKPLEAQAHLLAAGKHASQGDAEEAAHHARLAGAFYRQVGATRYLTKTDSYLPRQEHTAGGSPSVAD